MILVLLLNPKFATDLRQGLANFGFAALVGLRIDPPAGHDLSRARTAGKTGAAGAISSDRTVVAARYSEGMDLRALLKLSSGIDWLNEQFGVVANWLVLFACLISAGNAASRYLFSESSNGWLEVQWYMFAGMVLLGGPYTLKMNEHVRVDLVYGLVSEKTRIWIDIVGGLLFLLPICIILIYFTWPWFVDSWRLGEESSNAGGLIRWPVKLVLPVGFALMVLQGISELIKRVAALEHVIEADFKYEKPLQ
jgi:TRAP-type mannitol/chloroaromatic compound transport system permease small subunit